MIHAFLTDGRSISDVAEVANDAEVEALNREALTLTRGQLTWTQESSTPLLPSLQAFLQRHPKFVYGLYDEEQGADVDSREMAELEAETRNVALRRVGERLRWVVAEQDWS